MYKERLYRLTTSKFGIVLKRKSNHGSLIKQVLYAKVNSTGISALMWGQQHDTDALAVYQISYDAGLTVQKAGIYVGDFGFLGASPDGVVVDESGCKE